ncbi:hypothetical protein OIO90_004530 [Microbotryomycetes sp. JL221]|nr:hypothetical protein OIO90_004530 [Microbotryomycetes sp. JL221]
MLRPPSPSKLPQLGDRQRRPDAIVVKDVASSALLSSSTAGRAQLPASHRGGPFAGPTMVHSDKEGALKPAATASSIGSRSTVARDSTSRAAQGKTTNVHSGARAPRMRVPSPTTVVPQLEGMGRATGASQQTSSISDNKKSSHSSLGRGVPSSSAAAITGSVSGDLRSTSGSIQRTPSISKVPLSSKMSSTGTLKRASSSTSIRPSNGTTQKSTRATPLSTIGAQRSSGAGSTSLSTTPLDLLQDKTKEMEPRPTSALSDRNQSRASSRASSRPTSRASQKDTHSSSAVSSQVQTSSRRAAARLAEGTPRASSTTASMQERSHSIGMSSRTPLSTSRAPASRPARRAAPRESTTLDEMIRQQQMVSSGRKVSSVFSQDASILLANGEEDDDDKGIGSRRRSSGQAFTARQSALSTSQSRRTSLGVSSGPPPAALNKVRTTSRTVTTPTLNKVESTLVSKNASTPIRKMAPPPSTMKQQREEEARLRKQLEDKMDELKQALESSTLELESVHQERQQWLREKNEIEAKWTLEKDRLEAETMLLENEVKALNRRHNEERTRWHVERKELADQAAQANDKLARGPKEPDTRDDGAAEALAAASLQLKGARVSIAVHQTVSALQASALRHDEASKFASRELEANAELQRQIELLRSQLSMWNRVIAV